jgi:SAM-dependent methyltransferase
MNLVTPSEERPQSAAAPAGKYKKRQDFLPRPIRKWLMRHFSLYDRYLYWTQVRRLLSYVDRKENFFKVPDTSFNIYESRGDYEHRDYETGSALCLVDGKIKRLSHREARDRYLVYLHREIDALLEKQSRLKVLEIGCGNCINLMLLKQRYQDRLDLAGMDISGQRIAVAKEVLGPKLDGVYFEVRSATDPVPPAEENQYDLVFSMHCLEQIPFGILQAVQGMYARTRQRVVMLEPVFEFARPSQKLFLIYSDFVRTLLPTVKYLGYKILRAEPLPIESSLKNQSSIIVVEK